MWTNGLHLAGAGTSFPALPTLNDVFFRTDLGVVFYYNANATWRPAQGTIQTKAANTTAQTAFVNTLKGVAASPSYAAGALALSLAFTMFDYVNNALIVDVSCGSIQNSVAGDYTQMVVSFDDNGVTGRYSPNGATTCCYQATANTGSPHSCKILIPPNFFAQAATTIRVCIFGAANGTRSINKNGTVQAAISALTLEAREIANGY